ncbi:MAG: hypothetical protein UR27_C0001G0050 [Candidatus Peregrinibacteria bacterium GW2011_GWA2_33_10]|nr:MAG: hypothetical protein UR27_C0001G0050 [Candidatus Peregrinibacteria bacterium GW2011_GWA2_33_10]KKP39779.1 MAG: hypothetical protein UR30_C0008G0048 [Candidatus Peregrinibacteria bacterium GW2011_GWC2_33_13]OGJ48238.1 MAG: hypothetical protein A2229_04825 [Candidatus Peregrinibacteria bacterium RIFOXYA2_FULL_33_7]
MNPSKQEKLKLLIKTSILINKEEKKNYLDKIDSLSEPQINELTQIFHEEETKKSELINNKINKNKDPDLINKLKQIKTLASKEFLRAKERKEQQKDFKKLENLTQQINNFN